MLWFVIVSSLDCLQYCNEVWKIFLSELHHILVLIPFVTGLGDGYDTVVWVVKPGRTDNDIRKLPLKGREWVVSYTQ